MKTYHCNLCNKKHQIYYGSDSPMPAILSDNNEDEIIRLSDHAYILNDKDLIIKGNLEMKLNFSQDTINHYLWGIFPANRLLEQINELEKGNQIKLQGKLLTENPFFENTKDLATDLYLTKTNKYGNFFITGDHQIRLDQVTSISSERIIEMMQRLDHPEVVDGVKVFEESFKDRLLKMLDHSISEYINQGKYFVININDHSKNLIQLIASELLEQPSVGGVGLHLCNDSASINYTEIKEKVKRIQDNCGLSFIEIEGVETYQKNYGQDLIAIHKDMVKILNKVFEAELETLDVDIFEP